MPWLLPIGKHHAQKPYFHSRTYIVGHFLLPPTILKMVTEMYIKTLEQLQQKTHLGPKGKNYTLDTECENLRTRIYGLVIRFYA
jgi:hypothetical protein